jgi:hypothetical protein
MSKFTGELDITPNRSERLARINQPFLYASDLLGFTLTIPKNFLTDGASVPRLFWSILPPWGDYGKAAIVHDYLYRWQRTPKAVADKVLLEGMWVLGCAFWEYAAIYLAVHWFGSAAWSGDKSKPLSLEELAPNRDCVYCESCTDKDGFEKG